MAIKEKLSYWERRTLEQERAQQRRIDPVENRISNAYLKAQDYLTNQIHKLFNRAKTKNGFEEDELKNILKQNVQPSELVELQKLSKDISDTDIQSVARGKLNALAAKGRITRLEDLKAKMHLVTKQVADVQLKQSTDFFIDEIQKAYDNTAEEDFIRRMEAKGITVETWNKKALESAGHEFKELSTKETKNILDSHWHASNYSKRIWGDTEALAKRLEELFTIEAMSGMSERDMVNAIVSEFGRSVNVSRRLIRTEANYMANQAKLKAWLDRGVKQYMLIAILDLRTSEICQNKDRQVYNVVDAVVNGVDGNYPPFHPWCRTVAVAYYGDMDASGMKTVNDPISNKTFEMDRAANYNDWLNAISDKHTEKKVALKKQKIQNAKADKSRYKKMVDMLGKDISPKTFDDYQEIKYNDGEDWKQLKLKCNMQKLIDKGSLSLDLNQDKQLPHDFSSPKYDEYVKRNSSKGKPTPSYFVTDNSTLQKVINDNYLGGHIARRNSGQYASEIELNHSDYGIAYDRNGLNPVATNRFKIHISKQRTHIVPMYPKEGS